MTLFYFILLPILALILWLIARKKWKALLWTTGSLILVAVAGWFEFLYIVAKVFGEKCGDNRVWAIEDYVIIEKKCIGFAGPYYYPVYLYKGNKFISNLSYISDTTCIIQFKTDLGDTLTFDICQQEMK